MFIGEYNHTIDAKNRLIIPSKFREVLGDSFMVSRGLDECLYIFEQSEWDVFEEKIRKLPLSDKKARRFGRFLLAGAACVEVDRQGRILLPSSLVEFAGLQKEAVLLGVGSRIEIWSREKLDEELEAEDMDSIAEHMAELGVGI